MMSFGLRSPYKRQHLQNRLMDCRVKPGNDSAEFAESDYPFGSTSSRAIQFARFGCAGG